MASTYESRPVTLQMSLDPVAFLFYLIGISIKFHESYFSNRSFISVTKKLKIIILNDNYLPEIPTPVKMFVIFLILFVCAPARHLLRRISSHGGQCPSDRHAAAAGGPEGRLAAPAGQPQSFRPSEPASQASTFPLVPGLKKFTYRGRKTRTAVRICSLSWLTDFLCVFDFQRVYIKKLMHLFC